MLGISNKVLIFASPKRVTPACEPYGTFEDYTKTLLIFISTRIMAYVIGNNCVACGTCIDECPVGAISEGEIYHINPDECTECGTCASVCPNEAISLPE